MATTRAARSVDYLGVYLPAIGKANAKTALAALYPVATFGERGAAIALATDVAVACIIPAFERRTAPTYAYELLRAAPNGPYTKYKAFHGFDIAYLFNMFAVFGVAPAPEDLALGSSMQAAWGALARGDTPSAWPAAPMFRQLDVTSSNGTTWRGNRCAQLENLGLLLQ